MTMDLEVHINAEVHLVPWQSLLRGHKSSHPSPELPVSPLALTLHEPQVLHTYRPTYLPTHQKGVGPHQKSHCPTCSTPITPQMMGSRQKTQPNPPEQQKNNQKKHRTQTKGPYPNPKKANKLKKDSHQKKTTQNTRQGKKNLSPATQGQQTQILSITITRFNPDSLQLWHTRTLPPHNSSKL